MFKDSHRSKVEGQVKGQSSSQRSKGQRSSQRTKVKGQIKGQIKGLKPLKCNFFHFPTVYIQIKKSTSIYI